MNLIDTLFSHLDDVVTSQARIERANQVALGAANEFDYYWRVQQSGTVIR